MSVSTGLPAGPPSRPSRSSLSGFTLIEVLVAFAILAVTSVALLRLFSGGFDSARVSEAHVLATLAAESTLAAVGTELPLVVGETSGRLNTGMTWHLDIHAAEGVQPANDKRSQQLYEVVVTVSWSQDNGERSVSLVSLRLAPRS